MAKVLFHIDLNAFFASAEEIRYPHFKDKPLAIAMGDVRGVVSTCNYAAREYGIHSAMPLAKARTLCPTLEVLPADHEYYRKLSNQFFTYLRQYSGKLEILSIDECFLDVSDIITQFPRPLDLAVLIQRGLLDTLGLKCSIGVAPTRFLAKMASDLYKPMGISVIRKRDIPTKLYPLPIESCFGIGKRTIPRLKEKGILKIGDLISVEHKKEAKAILQNRFIEIEQNITGQSSAELVYSTTRKSFSHSKTFVSNLYTYEEVLEQLSILTRQLAFSMAQKHQKGQTISLTLRDATFHNTVHSKKLPYPTNDYFVLYEAISGLLSRSFEPIGYRLVGLSIGSLLNEEQVILQPTLFESIKPSSADVIASLNKQGAGLMKLSDLLKEEKAPENHRAENEKRKKEIKEPIEANLDKKMAPQANKNGSNLLSLESRDEKRKEKEV